MNRFVTLIAVLCSSLVLAASYVVPPGNHGQVTFIIEGPIDDVPGETRAVSGKLELDPASWANLKGVVAVKLDTIRTGISQRDEDMRTEFLQVERFPFAVLQIEKIERPSAGALSMSQTSEGEAVGSFEVHGVRRQVRFPATLRMDPEGRVWAKGSFPIAFGDYNINRPQRLFLKLGDVVQVSFDVAFALAPSAPAAAAPAPTAAPANEPAPPSEPTVATVLPLAAKTKPKAARKAKPQLTFTTLFTGDDAKAKGERLFHSTDTGGAGNKLTCFHCHAKADERAGLKQADGFVRAGSTMWNASQRGSFWNGFASTAGAGGNICQKMFMKGTGLSSQQQQELSAFVEALGTDASPALDARVLYRTYESGLRDPIAGDADRGKKLADVYCMTCHLEGRVGPVWQPGLYEPDWVVARVRHLEGHSARIMPPFSISRLSDSELRDIVTYLTGPKAGGPVFERKKKKN